MRVARAQHVGDLGRGDGHVLRLVDRDQQLAHVAEGRALQQVRGRGPGHDHHVVLVRTVGIGALGSEHADHAERDVLDAHRSAQRRFPEEELVRHRAAEQADLGRGGEASCSENISPSSVGHSRTEAKAGLAP